jgi:hypothetical protein
MNGRKIVRSTAPIVASRGYRTLSLAAGPALGPVPGPAGADAAGTGPDDASAARIVWPHFPQQFWPACQPYPQFAQCPPISVMRKH